MKDEQGLEDKGRAQGGHSACEQSMGGPGEVFLRRWPLIDRQAGRVTGQWGNRAVKRPHRGGWLGPSEGRGKEGLCGWRARRAGRPV